MCQRETKTGTGPREAGHNGADRDLKYLGYFFVVELMNVREQDDRAIVFRKGVESLDHLAVGQRFRNRLRSRRKLENQIICLVRYFERVIIFRR